jgi:hypothetical protein
MPAFLAPSIVALSSEYNSLIALLSNALFFLNLRMGSSALAIYLSGRLNHVSKVSQISYRSSISLTIVLTLPVRLFSLSAQLSNSSLTCP